MDGYNLLVIDDDPNIRKLLNELLTGRSDFRLLVAGSGQEAVRYFAEHRIDVVLTDIHMPGFTGLELMADMKKINFKPEILVMTANATPENVETARKIGARSVILKPFDDLEVIEAEINKALQAAKAARAQRGGHEATAADSPAAVAATASVVPTAPRPAPAAPPAARPKAAPAPSMASAVAAASKAALWPAPKPKTPAPVAVAPAAPETPDSEAAAVELPEIDGWQGEITGNETPPPAVAAPRPAPASPPRPAPAAASAPPRPAPAPPPRKEKIAPPAPAAPARRPAAQAPAPVVAQVTPGAETAEVEPEIAPEGDAAPAEEAIPEIPLDLEAIFRTTSSFDTGRMRMQVPIICLQTWEERGAIAALRRLAAGLQREFYVWSAARGLIKDGGQAMGDNYRDAGRALEFIRRQKVNGLYVLVDFRPCLDDRTVVRVLREMVMDLETARSMLVLTAPRLPAPPELAQACMTFDWPAGGEADLLGLYQEVVAEIVASTGRVVSLNAAARDALLKTVKDMPAGRARFEIARALMAAKAS